MPCEIFGSKDYSIRVWLRPDVLAKLGLTPGDVAAAIREQNAQFAAGRIGEEPMKEGVDFTFTVTTQGRLTEPEEFGRIVIRTTPDGGVTRLADVARIELGSRAYDFSSTRNGRPTVPIGVFLAPGANALQVGAALDARMAELAKRFPAGLEYSAPYDTTTYIRVSIREVLTTLVEAMLLVFAVVFLFLQNWRATLIPMVAVPVSLIGTLAAMLAFGFSINTLTLFGMVLAIGIVVDDAIVVLENVERIMASEGLEPREATHKAMQQVTRPVIAIVFVLTAVFLPIAFLGGLIGEMYRQFAVTIAVSVAISGFVALTLTPALCASVLRHEDVVNHGILERFNLWFARMTGKYANGVAYLLRHTTLALILVAAMLVATVALFRAVPAALAPKEDQGFIMVIPILQDAASLQRTEAVNKKITEALLRNPAVEQVMAFSGLDVLTFTNRTNTGIVWVNLKDWAERKSAEMSAGAVAGYVFAAGAQIKDAFVLAFEPPPIDGLSMTGGFDGFVQSRQGGSMKELEAAVQSLAAAASKRKELASVQTTFSASVPQIHLELDREKAKLLGIRIADVYDTLQSTFGALYVNDFNREGRVFRVHLQSEAEFRARPGDIRNVYVRAGDGTMVPLTAVVTVHESTGPEVIERYNVFPSAKILGDAAPGYSSGEALAAMEAVAREALPEGYSLEWTGTSYQEKVAGGSSTDGLPGRRADGVPRACGAVREVDVAVRGHPRRAVRAVRRVPRRVPARPAERPVLPDRPRDAGRPGLQERDPHRRVRAAEGAGRHVARGRRGRGRATAVPPDRDDVAGLHSRRDAARDQRRCRRRQPAFDRHGRHRWHARRDLHRDLLRAFVLPLDRLAWRGQVPRADGGGQRCSVISSRCARRCWPRWCRCWLPAAR